MPYIRLLLCKEDNQRLNAILKAALPAKDFVSQVECKELGYHPLHFTLCGAIQRTGVTQEQVQEVLRSIASRHGTISLKLTKWEFSKDRVKLKPLLPAHELTALAQDMASVFGPLGSNTWFAQPENHHVTCGAKLRRIHPRQLPDMSRLVFNFDRIEYETDGYWQTYNLEPVPLTGRRPVSLARTPSLQVVEAVARKHQVRVSQREARRRLNLRVNNQDVRRTLQQIHDDLRRFGSLHYYNNTTSTSSAAVSV